PADFNGVDASTGHFSGSGMQDVLAYYPHGGTGANAGEAKNLFGSGGGSPIRAQRNDVEHTTLAGRFHQLPKPPTRARPRQLANAGNTSGNGYAYPDLIGISGDQGSGYFLNFYQNLNGTGNYNVPYPLLGSTGSFVATPSGGSDWNHWVIATAQLPAGTAMYLWNPGTGGLYLWAGLHAAYDPNADSWALSYTQYVIADGTPAARWNQGAALTLQAADINGDGVPDLWATGNGGTLTA